MLKQFIKRTLFLFIYYSGALCLSIYLLTRLRKVHPAIILFYHRFSPGPPDPYQLPQLDIREFRKQVRHVKRWYDVVSMTGLANALAEKRPFSRPTVCITIDDGFLSNYTLAYPVLRRENIPAMIYLPSGLIGTKRAPWVDELMGIVSETAQKSVILPAELGGIRLDTSSRSKKREASKKIFEMMIAMDDKQRRAVMEGLKRVFRVRDERVWKRERTLLNWEEVAEMKLGGISFGAHTVSHPILSKMDLQAAMKEIRDSKEEIEKRLGTQVKHFAIPNGKKEDFSDELKAYCKKIGFTTVVSTEPGLVGTESDPYFLRRILPPPPMHIFACELARHMFFGKSINFSK